MISHAGFGQLFIAPIYSLKAQCVKYIVLDIGIPKRALFLSCLSVWRIFHISSFSPHQFCVKTISEPTAQGFHHLPPPKMAQSLD